MTDSPLRIQLPIGTEDQLLVGQLAIKLPCTRIQLLELKVFWVFLGESFCNKTGDCCSDFQAVVLGQQVLMLSVRANMLLLMTIVRKPVIQLKHMCFSWSVAKIGAKAFQSRLNIIIPMFKRKILGRIWKDGLGHFAWKAYL